MRRSINLCLVSAFIFPLLTISPQAWSSDSFTLIIASDLHFGHDLEQSGWSTPYTTYDSINNVYSPIDPGGIFANWKHVSAMNQIRTTTCGYRTGFWPGSGAPYITEPLAVMLNGDLADRWENPYAHLYKQFYEPTFHTFHAPYMGYHYPDDKDKGIKCRSYECSDLCADPACTGAGDKEKALYNALCDQSQGPGCPPPEKVAYPVLPGLGNHDYVQNAGPTSFPTAEWQCGSSGNYLQCAKNAVTYMQNVLDRLQSSPPAPITNFSVDPAGSLAYSFEIKGFHFIQLQYRPDYSNPSIGVPVDAMDFLKDDLDQAKARSKKVILAMHDYPCSCTNGTCPRDSILEAAGFYDHFTGVDLIAIFAGHTHQVGYICDVDFDSSLQVPLFRSGAALKKDKFLLVQLEPNSMTVGAISSKGEDPEFIYCSSGKDPDMLKTITF
jgi:hypothetical protein